jgi:hypothetical protein
VELAARLDLAGASYDESRLIDKVDVSYQLWLQIKLKRVTDIHNENVRRQEAMQGG